ncbi:MAG: coproporphyrinogen dehydrogenase HemZ [Firmicutes bacterium HGW-Firmicutes-21]|nr:MAG: coproporphyrinogen dehydrogenase HemZ [Firmicutes bacterium HGW-Firmicutes-21]
MTLIIDNRTRFFNDYYFQTMCLMYYPGERFPPAGDDNANTAFFLLEEVSTENGRHYNARVRLEAGIKHSEAVFSSEGYTPVIEQVDEFLACIAVGKAFLLAGRELFGFSLPWGYITGLRPVKRAKNYLERGYDEDSVRSFFTDDFGVSPQKAALSVSTARREIDMLSGVKGNLCALYVSIPFCPTRCGYCSFVSYSNERLFRLIPDYLVKLKEDIKRTAAIIKELNFSLGAIYIGGGTPSILDCLQLDDLLGEIQRSFDFGGLSEYTFEAGRPDTVTHEKLTVIKSHGVDRISINPQSTNDAVLKRIGRCHTSSQFFTAAETAKKVGFTCINGDLIAGLPDDNEESFARSLSDVISLGFENITVHTLSIKNAAELRFDPEKLYDPVGETAKNCVSFAYDKLTKEEYNPYYLYRQKKTVGNAENTGYAKEGYENLYNVLMMEEYSTVFACGAGSITKIVSPDRENIERIAYPKYPFEYLEQSIGIGEDIIRRFFSKHT